MLLRKSQMRQSQKISLCIFLCLSFVMIIAALTRVGGYRYRGVLDLTWEIFWQWVEACIAVIMGSMTAFRSLFVSNGSVIYKDGQRKAPSYSSVREKLLKKFKRSRDSSWDELEQNELPEIPSATMNGMRTFIRRNNRSGPGTRMTSGDQEEDYSFGPPPNSRVGGIWKVGVHNSFLPAPSMLMMV